MLVLRECMRGKPKNWGFIYKKLCIYSYMFQVQSPSQYSPFDAIHLSRLFSTTKNSFWTCWFWCLLVLLPFFVSPLHIGKTFVFEDFFHLGKQKKVAWGEMGWIGRVGPGDHAGFFGQKWNTQHGVGRCAHESLIMKWANLLKVFKTKIHWSWTQPLTTPPAGTLI